jgi:hypothetical protein
VLPSDHCPLSVLKQSNTFLLQYSVSLIRQFEFGLVRSRLVVPENRA